MLVVVDFSSTSLAATDEHSVVVVPLTCFNVSCRRFTPSSVLSGRCNGEIYYAIKDAFDFDKTKFVKIVTHHQKS